MKTIVPLILIACLFAGCGPGYCWYKKDTSLQQAEQDCKECYQQAIAEKMTAQIDASRQAHVSGTPYLPEVENDFDDSFQGIRFTNCMRARGYRHVSEQYLPTSVRKKGADLPSCSSIPSYDLIIAGE